MIGAFDDVEAHVGLIRQPVHLGAEIPREVIDPGIVLREDDVQSAATLAERANRLANPLIDRLAVGHVSGAALSKLQTPAQIGHDHAA